MGNATRQPAEEGIDSQLKALGDSLRLYRRDVLQYTLDQMATRLGLGRMTCWRMERGDPGVSVEAWMKAWREMGVAQQVIAAAEPDLFEAHARDFPEFG